MPPVIYCLLAASRGTARAGCLILISRPRVLRLAHQLAVGDEVNELAEAVAFRFPFGLEAAQGRLIGEAEGTSKGIR